MITGEPVKSSLRGAVDFILDHPKTAGFSAAIALAVSLSPKASTIGSWICLSIALLFFLAMVAGFREKYRIRYGWVALAVSAVLVALGAIGWWLTHPTQEATSKPSPKTVAQLFEDCNQSAVPTASVIHQPSGDEMFIPPQSGIQFRVGANTQMSGQFEKERQIARCRLMYAPQELTLRDLFNTDFANSSGVTSYKFGMFTFSDGDTRPELRIDFEIIENLDIANKFMSFYIPDADNAMNACTFLATGYKQYLDVKAPAMIAKAAGNSDQFDSRDLTFSNRIYLYVERDLSLHDLAKISDTYKKRGLSVIIRGPDYVGPRRLAMPLNK